MSPYRGRAAMAPAPKRSAGCAHFWEVCTIWAAEDWVIVGWRRRCVHCRASQPFWRCIKNAWLDLFRLWGVYDRHHEHLDADCVGTSLHMEPRS